MALSAAQALADTNQVTFSSQHNDYRTTPKLEKFATTASLAAVEPEAAARAFLTEHGAAYGLSPDFHELTLGKVQHSLLGTHFHFTQAVDEITVDQGEVVVSVSNATGGVYSAYNNFYPAQEPVDVRAGRRTISKDKAFDAAWADLRVHGKLQTEPKADLRYRVDAKGKFRLVYVTYLNTQAPFGAWQTEVDAVTGKVLSRRDTAIINKKGATKVDPKTYTGPVTDRAQAFSVFAREKAEKSAATRTRNAPRFDTVNGTALVFDPDPRTTLNNSTLEDDSPADAFTDAYIERELKDITVTDGVYKLEGPWVKIGDFESPTSAPSTTTDGHWTAKRGDDAFDDAMVYFHIDQSQRYMQSLGFTGDKAIQGAPLEADSNGVNGDDNSHFIPGDNVIAYGHGCVNDSEDPDVILHEYGHAINSSINSNFDGGDTGAIGEGFGDYWAASYSLSTPNGMAYRPFEIFSWDGHGDHDACWPGRVLDATDIMYSPTRTYEAHGGLENGRQTDELWSTPTFQALTTLLSQGVARSEVDQIVLEAQFGLGAGITMRELAEATIAAARELQPAGPHASVFIDKFAAQHIIDIPQAILAVDHVDYTGLGDNNVADPGETVGLAITLGNTGTLDAGAITATLTSETEGVSVENGQLTFQDIAAGAAGQAEAAANILVGADVACGTTVHLSLTVNFRGGLQPSAVIPVEFTLGVPQGMAVSASPGVAIPDDDETGVQNAITVDSEHSVTSNLAVDVNIEHTYTGDLEVALTSPSGTRVVLHNNTGGSNDNIVGRYPTDLSPAESLAAFVGEPMSGEWTLSVVDSAGQDVGTIVSWGLHDVAGYECQAAR
jgi:subtilisin-like proprotein convertase family protein